MYQGRGCKVRFVQFLCWYKVKFTLKDVKQNKITSSHPDLWAWSNDTHLAWSFSWATFHLTKTIRFNFRKIPVTNGSALSKISRHNGRNGHTQLHEVYQIFVNVLLGSFGWMIHISEIFVCSRNFSMKFIAICSHFPKFLVEWKGHDQRFPHGDLFACVFLPL